MFPLASLAIIPQWQNSTFYFSRANFPKGMPRGGNGGHSRRAWIVRPSLSVPKFRAQTALASHLPLAHDTLSPRRYAATDQDSPFR